MVVPRGTAARHEEDNALLELEAALSACLHPPSSAEPPTLKTPEVRPDRNDTLTGALLVFPRQPPTLVAQEAPRPFARTMLMEPPRITPPPLPVPMATTLTLNGPPPWQPTPLPFAPAMPAHPLERSRPTTTRATRPRSRAKWLVMLVVLFAVTGVLAVRPQLRARSMSVAVATGKRVAKTAVIVKDHARRALHR